MAFTQGYLFFSPLTSISSHKFYTESWPEEAGKLLFGVKCVAFKRKSCFNWPGGKAFCDTRDKCQQSSRASGHRIITGTPNPKPQKICQRRSLESLMYGWPHTEQETCPRDQHKGDTIPVLFQVGCKRGQSNYAGSHSCAEPGLLRTLYGLFGQGQKRAVNSCSEIFIGLRAQYKAGFCRAVCFSGV